MAHESVSAEFSNLIDEYSPVAQLGSGFDFTEGPIWHPVEHYLLFSDMPGDMRRRWDKNGISEVQKPSNKGNGMTYDADLNLIVCEHSTSSLVRLFRDGTRQIMASHFEGRELNSPNDVCIRSCGSVYFTDPWYGRMPGVGVERPRELGWQGVFRVKPGEEGQEPELLVDRYMFSQPNGLCFSPDEKLMYINDTEAANIRVFDVNPDGTLTNQREFSSNIIDPAKPGVPDGMKCDASGNVWVTAPGGLWVFSPAGRLIGKVSIPEKAANFHWGGEDWRTLFVCATHSLYSVKTKVGPRGEPYMRARPAEVPAPQNPAPTTQSSPPPQSEPAPETELQLDTSRCALIIQDMQNDVVMDGGAFADSGSPQHCREQNCIANIVRLAQHCRSKGIPVIHIWFKTAPNHIGLTQNAPLFEATVEANALLAGTWGAEPVPGLEAQPGDHVVTKMRMSGFEGTTLETVLKAEGRDVIIETGAWTNMSIEHTARTGADKGYIMVIPEDGCSTMNAEWHNASINFALTNVAAVTKVDEVIRALK